VKFYTSLVLGVYIIALDEENSFDTKWVSRYVGVTLREQDIL
jgi:hypothetical protein